MSNRRTQTRMRILMTWATTLGALATLSACSDLSTRGNDRPRRGYSRISKTTWMNALPGAMSDEFCGSDSPLMRCYSLATEDCHLSVGQIVSECEQSYTGQIPANLNKSDAMTWGGTIGNCAKSAVLQLIQTRGLVPSDPGCRESVEKM